MKMWACNSSSRSNFSYHISLIYKLTFTHMNSTNGCNVGSFRAEHYAEGCRAVAAAMIVHSAQ